MSFATCVVTIASDLLPKWDVVTRECSNTILYISLPTPPSLSLSPLFHSSLPPSPPQPPSAMFLSIGLNQKVRNSIQTVFTLAHRHSNILREGWKNLLDCLLALFKAKLLPEGLVEVCVCVYVCGWVGSVACNI